MFNHKQALRLALVFLFVLGACASRRQSGWEQISKGKKLTTEEISIWERRGQQAWASRHKKKSLEKALKAYESLAVTMPDNLEYLVALTRGYYLLADAHYDDVDQKKTYWEIGASWGEKAMATNKNFRQKIAQGEDIARALEVLGKREIAAIYWTASNLGKWAKSSGIATSLKYKNRIRGMIKKVEQLDNHFFHGAAYRYWGAYYAIAPGFAGGSMSKSLQNFKKAIKQAPEYLGTYVLYAENYATRKGDKQDFLNKLNYVLKANIKKNPKILPENTIEKTKAKKLLSKMEDYF